MGMTKADILKALEFVPMDGEVIVMHLGWAVEIDRIIEMRQDGKAIIVTDSRSLYEQERDNFPEITENKPIRLWRPLYKSEVDEPVATLTYQDITFEIPFTLMHWLVGWVGFGTRGSHAPHDAQCNMSQALTQLTAIMGYDASPLSEADKESYRRNHTPCERPELKLEQFIFVDQLPNIERREQP